MDETRPTPPPPELPGDEISLPQVDEKKEEVEDEIESYDSIEDDDEVEYEDDDEEDDDAEIIGEVEADDEPDAEESEPETV